MSGPWAQTKAAEKSSPYGPQLGPGKLAHSVVGMPVHPPQLHACAHTCPVPRTSSMLTRMCTRHSQHGQGGLTPSQLAEEIQNPR